MLSCEQFSVVLDPLHIYVHLILAKFVVALLKMFWSYKSDFKRVHRLKAATMNRDVKMAVVFLLKYSTAVSLRLQEIESAF